MSDATSKARDLKIICMENLLASHEIRIYFKDLDSRFLLVSAGCEATVPPGHALEELIGRTDEDYSSPEYAEAYRADELKVIRTGTPIVGKLEREIFARGAETWVSTSKMPLRNKIGEIIGTFGITRDVTAQVKAENALAYQVLHDPVTGLLNRFALMDRLRQSLVAMERQGGRLAILFIDLDYFKDVNDSFGHDAGDYVLAEAGRRISRISRRADSVARFGGDEFVVLCEALRIDDDVSLIANRIIESIGSPYFMDGHVHSVTCSVGYAMTDDSHTEPEQLIRDADVAMYEAKGKGRNRHHLFEPSEHVSTGANRLKTDLTRALDERELFLMYQPLFSLEDQKLVGVEALVRWRHPERGIVPPDDFIPFAEQHGLIGRIDSFVIDEACRQIAEWNHRDRWPSGFTMAINVSGRELSDANFSGLVESAIHRHAISPGLICLEITETAFVGGWGEIQETLASLASLGVRIALDDFGTGYSSLAHLQRMTVDLLKIDRSFVENIGRSERDREIVVAVMVMAHALGISVVGEGIETDQQLDTLAGMDCDLGQGFLLARPMSADSVVALYG